MLASVPTQQRLRATGIEQSGLVIRRLGREVRDLRRRAGLSQAQLARALGCSRHWICDLELGRLRVVDLGRTTMLFALLGHRLSLKAYPFGEPMRDAGQLRLLRRFGARVPNGWRRFPEAVMPRPGDLRAWDLLLRGPVTIGVDAETRLTDWQAVQRAVSTKQRDSLVDRVILLLADTDTNRGAVRRNIAAVRQSFPVDTRATLAALAAERDPGADGLVIL